MPPRRKNARRPLAAISEEAPCEPEAEAPAKPLSESELRRAQVVAELDQQVEERVRRIYQDVEDAAVALRHELSVLLMRLPLQVRKMPLVEFRSKYGGDVNAVLMEDIDARIAASKAAAAPATALRTTRRAAREPATAARTTRKGGADASAPPPRCDEAPGAGAGATRARAGARAAETPAAGPSGRGAPATPAAPFTAARGPRVGEACFSQTGSPLGVFEAEPGTQRGVLSTVLRGGGSLVTPAVAGAAAPAGAVATVIRRDKPGAKAGVADAILVQLQGGGQATVGLERGLATLPAGQRAEVQAQLLALRRLADAALSGRGK